MQYVRSTPPFNTLVHIRPTVDEQNFLAGGYLGFWVSSITI